MVTSLLLVQCEAGVVATLHLALHDITTTLYGTGDYYHYDFGFFYWAFRVIWGHQPHSWLYDQALQLHWMSSLHYPNYPHNQYVYPPQFAVFLSWFAALPFLAAARLWGVCSLLTYLASYLLITKLMSQRQGPNVPSRTSATQCSGTIQSPIRKWRWGRSFTWMPSLFVLGLWIGNYGFYADWVVGNVNWLVFFFLCLFAYFRWHKHRPAIAGIFLGLAILTKVSPIIVVGYCVMRRDWWTVASTALSAIVITVLSSYVIGWQFLWYYATNFLALSAESMKNGGAPYNSSVKGMLLWMSQNHLLPLHGSALSSLFAVYLLGMAFLISWTVRRHLRASSKGMGNLANDESANKRGQTLDPRFDAALALMSSILFSPLIEVTHLIVFVIPLTCTFVLWWESVALSPRSKTLRGRIQSVSVLVFLCAGMFLLSSAGQWLNDLAHQTLPWLTFTGMAATVAAVLLLPSHQKRVHVENQS